MPDSTRPLNVPRRQSISLSRPPALVAADPQARAVAAAAALQDGNPNRLTLRELDQFLARPDVSSGDKAAAATVMTAFFAKSTQDKQLRRDFLPITEQQQTDPEGVRALRELFTNPKRSLDSQPYLVSWKESQAAIASPDTDPSMKHALAAMGADIQQDFGPQRTKKSASGPTYEYYRDGAAALAHLEPLLGRLKQDPVYAALFEKGFNVYVGPQGVSAFRIPPDQVAPGDDLDPVGGFMQYTGFNANGLPTLALRGDYAFDDSTVVHELTHMLHARKDELSGGQMTRELEQAYAQSGFKLTDATNPAEMFAYFAEVYLAGFGAEIQRQAPAVYAVLAKHLGSSRVLAGTVAPAEAPQRVADLVRSFRAGR